MADLSMGAMSGPPLVVGVDPSHGVFQLPTLGPALAPDAPAPVHMTLAASTIAPPVLVAGNVPSASVAPLDVIAGAGPHGSTLPSIKRMTTDTGAYATTDGGAYGVTGISA